MNHISNVLHAVADDDVDEDTVAAAVILISTDGRYRLIDASPPDNGERNLMLAHALASVTEQIWGPEGDDTDFTTMMPGLTLVH